MQCLGWQISPFLSFYRTKHLAEWGEQFRYTGVFLRFKRHCKVSAFLTMDFRTVLNSNKRPKEIPKKRSKGIWQVMKKVLLPVSSPSLGRLSQDDVIMCHPLFELDNFSAAFLAHTLLLISEGILPKKEVNSGFSAGFLCSWSWPCMWPDFWVKGRIKWRCCYVKSRGRNFWFKNPN